MVTKDNKLKMRLTAYRSNKGISFSFEHCGVEMVGIPQEQPHFNSDPVKWQCPICGRTINTDAGSFEIPRPRHISFDLEVDMEQGEKKILKRVKEAYEKRNG